MTKIERKFYVYWLDGAIEAVYGKNIVNALREAGYGVWCMPFWSRYEEVKGYIPLGVR